MSLSVKLISPIRVTQFRRFPSSEFSCFIFLIWMKNAVHFHLGARASSSCHKYSQNVDSSAAENSPEDERSLLIKTPAFVRLEQKPAFR